MQPTLNGIPELPPDRRPGRPTKAEAHAHAAQVRKAVMAGLPTRKQAKERAELGAERAAGKADAVVAGWLQSACKLTLEYAHIVGSDGFLIEEARVYAEGQGLAGPPDARSWGKVPTALKVGKPGKRLEACGAARASTSNGSLKTKWRAA